MDKPDTILVVRNKDGSTTPLLDWLQTDGPRRFLGMPPKPPTFSARELFTFGLLTFLIGLIVGWLFFG